MTATEQRIAELVQQGGMSYRSISKKLRVAHSAPRRWALTGKISLNNIGPLCNLLNIDVRTVFSVEVEAEEKPLRLAQQLIVNAISEWPEAKDEQLLLVLKLLRD